MCIHKTSSRGWILNTAIVMSLEWAGLGPMAAGGGLVVWVDFTWTVFKYLAHCKYLQGEVKCIKCYDNLALPLPPPLV